MSIPQIPAVFQSFLNQEVEVTENANARRDRNEDRYSVAPTDTTIKALADAVKQRGMRLEVCFPTMPPSLGGYSLDRLSIVVDKAANGRWMIAKMDIG